jgi:hypothetical protein
MAEVVVKLSDEETRDQDRLATALDAYATWCSDLMNGDNNDAFADFMMTTERTLNGINRKLIFRDFEHASRFLTFWNTQKNVLPVKKREY